MCLSVSMSSGGPTDAPLHPPACLMYYKTGLVPVAAHSYRGSRPLSPPAGPMDEPRVLGPFTSMAEAQAALAAKGLSLHGRRVHHLSGNLALPPGADVASAARAAAMRMVMGHDATSAVSAESPRRAATTPRQPAAPQAVGAPARVGPDATGAAGGGGPAAAAGRAAGARANSQRTPAPPVAAAGAVAPQPRPKRKRDNESAALRAGPGAMGGGGGGSSGGGRAPRAGERAAAGGAAASGPSVEVIDLT